MSAPRLAVVDYGAGNLLNLRWALERAGAEVTVIQHPQDDRWDAVVLPGVGAFGPAMERLAAVAFPRWIGEQAASRVPLIGVCLGMQLLFEGSEEAPGVPGLGLLAGYVRRMRAGPDRKLPHMGWNQLRIARPGVPLEGIAEGSYAYFVHSYAADPADRAMVLATADHGEEFAAVVAAGEITGLQFHPEKSSTTGGRILRNIVAGVGSSGRAATAAAGELRP